ncbi:MAG TPA: PIG-L family deacetylase [Anaerolineae bacterium]|nr:PIG-L family deacetylase [Anaerolineae bacterium]
MLSHLYLSPHLDDAVISCGGLIAQQAAAGELVSVLTICAGDPPAGPLSSFARELHERWGESSSPIAARRAEDRVACGRLDAVVVHLDIPDAIYRRDPEGELLYSSESEILGPVHMKEQGLIQHLADLLEEQCPVEFRIYCPLGVGGHVDHRLTRRAAERLNVRLWYYYDLPYSARGEILPPELGLPPGNEITWLLSNGEIDAWAAAVAMYQSQLSTFWTDMQTLHRELRDYHDTFEGLRLLMPEET